MAELINPAENIVAFFSAMGLPYFSIVGFGEPSALSLQEDLSRLDGWLAEGHHADMRFMSAHREVRSNPELLFPGARSAVVFAVPYWNLELELERESLQGTLSSLVARYAQGMDYHNILRRRLAALLPGIERLVGRAVRGRAVVDSAPMLERALARHSGLGFIGKNTMLIHREIGGLSFLATLLTDLPAASLGNPDAVSLQTFPSIFEKDFCGQCRRCIDSCPTGALLESYEIDARRCLSYLTIEHQGEIPDHLVQHLSETVFGCDSCVMTCPYTKKSLERHRELGGLSRAWKCRVPTVSVEEASKWSEQEYREFCRGTSLLRVGYQGFCRNLTAHRASRRV